MKYMYHRSDLKRYDEIIINNSISLVIISKDFGELKIEDGSVKRANYRQIKTKDSDGEMSQGPALCFFQKPLYRWTSLLSL